jgi:outer membrane receptor protein involved in Fe transport
LNGIQDSAAHAAARAAVDVNRPAANSARFKAMTDSIRSIPIKKGGALLVDKSDLYVVEGSYNLAHLKSHVANIEFLVGGNYKQYVLNSEGNLFADTAGKFKIAEYGGYVQASRMFLKNITLTASGRYDKNENFDGRFTPRATAVIKYGKNTDFRFSYQTAYRFPSNQQQYINLDIGSDVKLIGGNPSFRSFYNFTGSPIYDYESLRKGQLVPYNNADLKPESLTSFEGGWKGLICKGKLLVDLYGYFGKYKDFLGRQVFVQSKSGATVTPADTGATGRRFSIPVNSSAEVKTYGYGISLDYRLPWNFVASGNISSDNLKDVPTNFVAYFNSPKYKGNLSLGNIGFGKDKRWGFNVAYRFQQGYYYQGDFASGQLNAVQTVDAQASYKFPKIKSIFKVGGTNILDQYYYNAIGNSYIGGLYYVSFAYNVY